MSSSHAFRPPAQTSLALPSSTASTPTPPRKDSVARLVLPDHFQARGRRADPAPPSAQLADPRPPPMLSFPRPHPPTPPSSPACLTASPTTPAFSTSPSSPSHISPNPAVPAPSTASAAQFRSPPPPAPLTCSRPTLMTPTAAFCAVQKASTPFRRVRSPSASSPAHPRTRPWPRALDWTLKLSNYANRLPSDLLDADPEAYSRPFRSLRVASQLPPRRSTPRMPNSHRDAAPPAYAPHPQNRQTFTSAFRSRRSPRRPGIALVPDQN
jgi:hypothetical protein